MKISRHSLEKPLGKKERSLFVCSMIVEANTDATGNSASSSTSSLRTNDKAIERSSRNVCNSACISCIKSNRMVEATVPLDDLVAARLGRSIKLDDTIEKDAKAATVLKITRIQDVGRSQYIRNTTSSRICLTIVNYNNPVLLINTSACCNLGPETHLDRLERNLATNTLRNLVTTRNPVKKLNSSSGISSETDKSINAFQLSRVEEEPTLSNIGISRSSNTTKSSSSSVTSKLLLRPLNSRASLPFKRKARPAIQWSEQKLARDAAAAALRGVAASAYPNIAQRGLLLNPGELKSVDTLVSLAADSTTAVKLLNGIPRGDEISERIGRQVTLKSIEMRLRSKVTAGTGVDQEHRIIVVYDRQTNAAACSVADVLASSNVLYPRNLENRRRFRILFDRIVQLNASAESGSHKIIKWYRRLNHPVTFNAGDAGTVADITTGSLYCLVIGSEAAGATAGTVSGRVRVRFDDH